MKRDLAIIGAGPIGIFSCFQAGMLGIKNSVIIDALDMPGGQCSALYPEKPIYDIPAYPEISAQGLVDQLLKQAEPFEPEYLLQRQVNNLVINSDNSFTISTSKNDNITAKAILIAAGAGCFGPNRPPLKDIELYEGKSIFYMVKNKKNFAKKNILIAGGGDSALDWAISLSESANVTLLHRRNKFRALQSSVDKIHELAHKGIINIVTNYQLHELVGENGNLEQVITIDLNGNKKAIKTDILLPFFGLAQNLDPLENFGLNIKNHRIIAEPPYYQTNIEGIYAIGDVANYPGKLKLILTGFAEAASALHHAYSRIFDGKPLHFEYSTSKGVK